ncbi:rhodanese-like domain-containing protein [Patescibacteria group bacterium]|nr:MAG: rhodanese-like domain-containing protein [Patescibacteria group bacterium]
MTGKEITVRELKTLLESDGCFLVDVRDPEELAEGKIPKSILIPAEHLAEKLSGMRKDAPLVLYCRSGRRSRAAAEALTQAGFTDVRNLSGGLEAWQREQ